MPRFPSKSGFTLLELIVSIVILTLIVLMASQIFTSSTSAIERGSDDALLDEAARFVLDNLQTDISQALIRTNVPFRIDSANGERLYFVSTATRRQNIGNPRDLAPVQIRTMQRLEHTAKLNYRIIFEYLGNTQGNTKDARKNLIEQSRYYNETENLAYLQENKKYTEPLEDVRGLTDQAALTFIKFRINGDSSSNTEGLPKATDLPRYIDIIIGLTSANEMRQAMRIYETQGNSAALAHLADHERIYTRRIFVPNIGTTILDYK